MKPIHLNLASRPFRDYRPLYAVVVAASLLIAFLMLNNVETYYRYIRETETTRQEIEALEAQIKEERRRTELATNQIGNIDLKTLSRQSQFINAQLAERAFSWSELLERLEGVVPNSVRVTSIAPNFSDTGRVTLRMTCEAKSSEGMLVLLDRFNASPHFMNAFPGSETTTAEGQRFDMTVEYQPSIPRMVARR